MKNLVLYHSQCMDGTGAAAAHRLAVGKAVDEYIYVPINYNIKDMVAFDEHIEPYLDGQAFDTITMLDFCFEIAFLEELSQRVAWVLVVDHHRSALDQLPQENRCPKLFYIMSADNSLSGAGLSYRYRRLFAHLNANDFLRDLVRERQNKSQAWIFREMVQDQLFPVVTNIPHSGDYVDEEPNEVFDLIRIRDVWDESDYDAKFKADMLYYGLTASCGFALKPFETFLSGCMNAVPEMRTELMENMVDLGKSVYEIHRQNCMAAINSGYKAVVGDSKIHLLITASPHKQDSLLGELWRHTHPGQPTIAVGLSYIHATGQVVAGLRSSEYVDALPLATALGGGGHLKAAGCNLTTHIDQMSTSTINAWLVKLVEEIY